MACLGECSEDGSSPIVSSPFVGRAKNIRDVTIKEGFGDLGTDEPIDSISFFGTHQRWNRPWMVVLGSCDGADSERFKGIGVVGANAAGGGFGNHGNPMWFTKCSGYLHRN